MDDSNYEHCCGLSERGWDRVWIACAIVGIILTSVAVIVGTALTTQKDSLHRIAVFPKASDVFGAAGESNYEARGLISLNEVDNRVDYELRPSPAMSGITAIHIKGPIALASVVWAGPVAGVLCGATLGPGDGCDTTTTPGVVSGSVAYQIADNLTPGGVDLRPLMHDIRANCHLYYLEVLTNAKPTSPGALRGNLCQFAGWA